MARGGALRSDTEAGALGAGAPPAALAKALGHRFADPRLLEEALTHPSVERPRGAAASYERLEFLGDRVLGLVVAEMLFARFPAESEGELARRFAALVNAETLARVARGLGLGRHLRLARSEAEGGGRERTANLANALEAVIAALYLDAGFEPAARFVRRTWEPLVGEAAAPPRDPKTALQEFSQGTLGCLPEYRTLARTGPAHAPCFAVEVRVPGFPPATGEGRSKRAAERAAAAALLEIIGGKEPGRAGDGP